jgi:hypothetical protein
MAKRIDPAKAKAKRDKIIAAVLGCVLLAAGVFAVPMSLKQWKKLNGGGQAQPVAVQTTTTTPGTAPLATPTTAAGGIAGTVAAPIDTSRLHTFDLFDSKDPFDQQVDVSVGEASTAPALPGTAPSAPGGLTPTIPVTPTGPQAPAPAPTSAVISVNGAPAELLGVGVQFPLPPAEPLFRLHSLAKGVARIAIVGGSYSSGAPAVTIKVGKTLILENTADGTRYELKLLWVGAGAPPPGLVPAPPTAAPAATPSTPTSTP